MKHAIKTGIVLVLVWTTSQAIAQENKSPVTPETPAAVKPQAAPMALPQRLPPLPNGVDPSGSQVSPVAVQSAAGPFTKVVGDLPPLPGGVNSSSGPGTATPILPPAPGQGMPGQVPITNTPGQVISAVMKPIEKAVTREEGTYEAFFMDDEAQRSIVIDDEIYEQGDDIVIGKFKTVLSNICKDGKIIIASGAMIGLGESVIKKGTLAKGAKPGVCK